MYTVYDVPGFLHFYGCVGITLVTLAHLVTSPSCALLVDCSRVNLICGGSAGTVQQVIPMDGLNKIKRTRDEHVRQTISAYLQKRNIPVPVYGAISLEEQVLEDKVDSEVGRPNSILYSCTQNDPAAIELTFVKFLHWLKEPGLRINSDLQQLIAPLFCHLYLDILRGGHQDIATEFFKVTTISSKE